MSASHAQASEWKLRVTPRPWQLDAFRAWQRTGRGIVSVVTGGGKTVLALMCIADFMKGHASRSAVVVVPTLALLDQWYVSLQEDLGLAADRIAVYSGEELASEPKAVNLMVINTARNYAPALSECRDTLLIVDECHRAGSPANAQSIQGRHLATLGLSATPYREHDEGFRDYLVPCLGEVVYEYSYEQAHSDGVIVPFNLVNVRVDLLPDEQRAVDQLTRRIAKAYQSLSRGYSSEELLKRLLMRRASVVSTAALRVPTASKIVEQNRGERVLVFHERTAAAEAICRVLNDRGLSVATYHSRIGPNIRRSNLRLYRQGICQVLVTCRALDEGLNVPETTVAVVASSTASTRQRIQRLGRALRPSRGKSRATIYTVYATDLEEERLVREAKRFENIASVTWQRMNRR